MNWVKITLNRWTGAAAEIRLLKKEKAEICANVSENTMRNQIERSLVAALRAPDRWQPDEPITAAEAKDWAALLRTPLLVKIDLAMVNMAQQQAQIAVHQPAADMVRAAGYAAGFRGSWQLAKSLSTLAGTDAGKSETTPPTDDAGLDHLNP